MELTIDDVTEILKTEVAENAKRGKRRISGDFVVMDECRVSHDEVGVKEGTV